MAVKKSRIPVRELTYRGIDEIELPEDLCRIFERIIQALPDHEGVTRERCIDEFKTAWALEREGY